MKKYIFYTMIIGAFIFMPYTIVQGYGLCGVDWSYKTNPMGESVRINGNCVDSAAGTAENQRNEIIAGMNTWTNAGADFAFTYGGTSTQTSVTYNNTNLIYFDTTPPDGGGYIAANYIWYSGGNITENDIVFNDQSYTWEDGTPASNEMGIQNIATHELGHSLCLADLYGGGDSLKTMYGYAGYGETKKETLHSDDINGIIAIYGSGSNLPCELSGGTVTPSASYYGTLYEFRVHYFDQDGDSPSTLYAYVDGVARTMTLDSGTASNGTYRYQTRDLDAGVSHNYYFYATDPDGSDREPAAGTYSGPTNYDPELYWSGTPAPGNWLTIEVWGCVDALWATAWSSQSGPHYVPVTGLFWDLGPGDLHMAKRIGDAPLYLDAFGYGTYDFRIPGATSSGTKYMQSGTKMNAFWGQSNQETFVIP